MSLRFSVEYMLDKHPENLQRISRLPNSDMSDTRKNDYEHALPQTSSTSSVSHDSVHPASSPEEDTNVRCATPVGQEINNPNELSPTVEIDVVGDLTPRKTTGASVDSGIDVDMSNNTSSFIHKDDLPGPAGSVGQNIPERGSSGLRLSAPPVDTKAGDKYMAPSHQQPKPIHSSTPVSKILPSWPQPLHPIDFWSFYQPQAIFYHMNSIGAGVPYPIHHTHMLHPTNMLPHTHVLSQHAHVPLPRDVQHPAPHPAHYPARHPAPHPARHPAPHPAFNAHGFIKHPGMLAAGNHSNHQNPFLNPPTLLDQPLNLTTRRPFEFSAAAAAAAAATVTSPSSVYPAMGSSKSVPVASYATNPLSMAATSDIYPNARLSTNLFSRDPSSSQNVPSSTGTQQPPQSFDKCSVAGPSYALPALRVSEERPLSMPSGIKRWGPSSAECENVEVQGESKRRRVTKKGRKVAKCLVLTDDHIANDNIELKVESTANCQALQQFSPDQPIRGVTLALPPGSWRPISLLMKAKEKLCENDRKNSRALKSRENINDGDNETAKQRNKPELFGDVEITELSIVFGECPERGIFCDASYKFQVPKIPDSIEGQIELREALISLFGSSNLPPVPSALKHSVHALSQYPFMQHIFNLHAQGVNLDSLKFGAYGLAFENIHLVELGEQNFNDILDRMSYLGDDDLLHCLVKSEKTGAVCGHVAREIGKIRRHAKNHYPDKKWVCVFCRVQMCDMTDLERHTATHTELKPFECPQCSKKFCQKVTLTQHMHKTHGQQLVKWDAKSSYICRQDGCSYSQGEEMACVRHLKQHHAQSDYIKRRNQNKWPFNVLSADAIKSIDEEA